MYMHKCALENQQAIFYKKKKENVKTMSYVHENDKSNRNCLF